MHELRHIAIACCLQALLLVAAVAGARVAQHRRLWWSRHGDWHRQPSGWVDDHLHLRLRQLLLLRSGCLLLQQLLARKLHRRLLLVQVSQSPASGQELLRQAPCTTSATRGGAAATASD